jgi:hypothetical protein
MFASSGTSGAATPSYSCPFVCHSIWSLYNWVGATVIGEHPPEEKQESQRHQADCCKEKIKNRQSSDPGVPKEPRIRCAVSTGSVLVVLREAARNHAAAIVSSFAVRDSTRSRRVTFDSLISCSMTPVTTMVLPGISPER